MDDRELLEAAAKAAGMSGTTVDYDDRLVFLEDGKPASIEWNPLTDDGDALRLAVKLGLGMDSTLSRVWAFKSGKAMDVSVEEPITTNGAAATRRAIVRAAAAIASKES